MGGFAVPSEEVDEMEDGPSETYGCFVRAWSAEPLEEVVVNVADYFEA